MADKSCAARRVTLLAQKMWKKTDMYTCRPKLVLAPGLQYISGIYMPQKKSDKKKYE